MIDIDTQNMCGSQLVLQGTHKIGRDSIAVFDDFSPQSFPRICVHVSSLWEILFDSFFGASAYVCLCVLVDICSPVF